MKVWAQNRGVCGETVDYCDRVGVHRVLTFIVLTYFF